MLHVEFKEDWKDYKRGQIAQINDSLAYELMHSRIVINADGRVSENGAGVIDELTLNARKKYLLSMKAFYLKQIDLFNIEIEKIDERLGQKEEKKIKLHRHKEE